MSIAKQIIASHLISGSLRAGEEVAIKIDQTLSQDATGTLVMLELEAMAIERVKTELSAQYVDHNLVQEDAKNPDDHIFLQSACRRFGVWFSGAGNGISHVVHQENFGKPGKTLLGADSHTPAQGAVGMLAIGAGGVEVAMAMAGEAFHFKMPKIWHIHLLGKLRPWVSAKDVILELLRRHGVRGGRGYILEYGGPGLQELSVMDRHVIANMGTELGATTSIFPSDAKVHEYLALQERPGDWQELVGKRGEIYDREEELDLSKLEPLIALPSSPGKVVSVREVAGAKIYQAYIGSSANPAYRDFAMAAAIVKDKMIASGVSFDINPTSRQVYATIARDGHLFTLIKAGARVHQTGCNGCVGMGQAPATHKISLRTVPRNFPARSGTLDDRVYLVSPETAAASALKGVITDPRDLGIPLPVVRESRDPVLVRDHLLAPLPASEAKRYELEKGPNIVSLPYLEPLADGLKLRLLLKVGDDISTDEIMPPGLRVLPFRSNIPEISKFCFQGVDPTYVARTRREDGRPINHLIIAGHNYGQGSSREHAALAPRYLGLRVVIAKSFARIHWQNLVNFGILPLVFESESDYGMLTTHEDVMISGIEEALRHDRPVQVRNLIDDKDIRVSHGLSIRQREILMQGGIINWLKERLQPQDLASA